MDAEESLFALERRMHRAESRLRELAATDTDGALRSHRISKAQGVALALSYVREEISFIGLGR